MDARLTETDDRFALTLERRLAHPAHKVWRVLTEKELLHRWFPAHVLGGWEVGAPLRFEFQHGEGDGLPEEDMRGEVLAVQPERLLEFRWGKHVLRCELVPEEDGCRLLFSESFEDASWGARDAAGWEFCLQNLEASLVGEEPLRFVLEDWRGRFEHYRATFEPEFGPQAEPPEEASAALADEGGGAR